jgi:hypothetical protein
MLLTSELDGNEQSASVAADLSQFTLNHRIKPDAISLLLEMAGTCCGKRIVAIKFNYSCVYYYSCHYNYDTAASFLLLW